MVFKLTARTQGTGAPMEGISIRGASSGRNPTVGRIRRNAVTATSMAGSGKLPTVGVKVIDVWRDFVNRRWNSEAQFLNLEVSDLACCHMSARNLKCATLRGSPCWTIRNLRNMGFCRQVHLGRRRGRLLSSLSSLQISNHRLAQLLIWLRGVTDCLSGSYDLLGQQQYRFWSNIIDSCSLPAQARQPFFAK